MIVAEIVMAAAGDPRSPLHRAFVEWDDSRVAERHRKQNAYRRPSGPKGQWAASLDEVEEWLTSDEMNGTAS
jgi:hypothetical protein